MSYNKILLWNRLGDKEIKDIRIGEEGAVEYGGKNIRILNG